MAPFARYAATFYSSTLLNFNPTSINRPNRPHYFSPHRSLKLKSNTKLNNARIEIRDWDVGDGIYIANLLQQSIGSSNFDPEGPLEIDCGSEASIRASYNNNGEDDDDGACMLVAERMDISDDIANNDILPDDTTNTGRRRIVGTAALIVGTPITYMKSGSSMSTPAITGAIRRVCAVDVGDHNGEDSDNGSNDDNDDDGALSILRKLLMQIEIKATEAGVDELIILAYPASSPQKRPNGELLEGMGYAKLPSDLNGVEVEQYGKTLDSNDNSPQQLGNDGISESSSDGANINNDALIQDAAIALSFLGTIAIALFSIANFMGLELIPSNNGNRGIGSPLSVQELESLKQDEKLQRTDLDGGRPGRSNQKMIDGGRQWNDLSYEERQEEGALMKIIQGQDVRLK
mmetsp:Transcript_3209/g.7135  ORF Transcript_3209/g.7135 Transcript_3209/m.7135 type:complete len:404 (+) Transcript_3209:625-1836(+)